MEEVSNIGQTVPKEMHSETRLPNKNTIGILGLVHALQSQLKEPPNFSTIQKHHEGNLNGSQLKGHLRQLVKVGFLSPLKSGRQVLFQLTGPGREFIETIPEEWSRLQATKKRLTF